MKKLFLLVLPLLVAACTPNGPEELAQPRALSVSSNAVYDSVIYETRPNGLTIDYRRIADTTFTDPVTQEVVPGISYTVLVYDSIAIKAPHDGEVQLVTFRRPSGKPSLNLSSINAPDNVYPIYKNNPTTYDWSYLFYYKRVPAGTYQPMVIKFCVGKYADDTDMRYADISNWDWTTVNVVRKNGNISSFHLGNPYRNQ